MRALVAHPPASSKVGSDQWTIHLCKRPSGHLVSQSKPDRISPPPAVRTEIGARARRPRSCVGSAAWRPAEPPSAASTTSRSPAGQKQVKHVSRQPKGRPAVPSSNGRCHRPVPCQLRYARPSQPCRLCTSTLSPSSLSDVVARAPDHTGDDHRPSRCAVVKRRLGR